MENTSIINIAFNYIFLAIFIYYDDLWVSNLTCFIIIQAICWYKYCDTAFATCKIYGELLRILTGSWMSNNRFIEFIDQKVTIWCILG